MKKLITLFCLMTATSVLALTPSLYMNSKVEDQLKKKSITMVQESSLDLYWTFTNNAAPLNLTGATAVQFVFAPSSGEWTQIITGSIVSAANGQVKIPFTPTVTATNGFFEFDLIVSSNSTVLVKEAKGNLNLLSKAGGSTNTFPTTTNIVDLTGYTFLNYPWIVNPSGNVRGDIMYFNGTVWSRLAAGTSGYYLQSQGGGSDPIWDLPSGAGTITNIYRAAGIPISFTTPGGPNAGMNISTSNIRLAVKSELNAGGLTGNVPVAVEQTISHTNLLTPNGAADVQHLTAAEKNAATGTIANSRLDADLQRYAVNDLSSGTNLNTSGNWSGTFDTHEGSWYTDWSNSSNRFMSLLGNPAANWTNNFANKTWTILFSNPAGGITYKWQGAASGHLFDLLQETGNPGADTHMMHIEANDADVVPLHLTHNSGNATSLIVEGNSIFHNYVRLKVAAAGTNDAVRLGQMNASNAVILAKARDLSQGTNTVPLASLSGITSNQIDAATDAAYRSGGGGGAGTQTPVTANVDYVTFDATNMGDLVVNETITINKAGTGILQGQAGANNTTQIKQNDGSENTTIDLGKNSAAGAGSPAYGIFMISAGGTMPIHLVPSVFQIGDGSTTNFSVSAAGVVNGYGKTWTRFSATDVNTFAVTNYVTLPFGKSVRWTGTGYTNYFYCTTNRVYILRHNSTGIVTNFSPLD